MRDDELKHELPPAAEHVAPTPRSALGPSAQRPHHLAMQANYGNAAVLRHVDAQRATAYILEAAKKGIGDAERGHDAQKDWMERVRGTAGVLSDFFNDVTPPSIEAWNSAKHTLAAAEREAKQGSIKNAYMYLRQGYQSLVDAQRQWGAYTKGSVAGAEHTVATLRTIRDGAIAVEVGLATGGLAYAAVGSGVVGATTAALLGTGAAAKTATKFDSPLGEAARGTERELSLMSGREKLRLAAYGIYGMVLGAGKFLSNVPHGIKVTIEGIGKLLSDLGSDTITGEGKFNEDVDRFRQSLEDLWSQRDELVTWFEHMEPEQQAKAVGQFFGSIEGTIALSGLSQAVGKGLGESNLGVTISKGGGFGSAGRNVAALGAAAKRFVSLKPLIQALTPALAPSAVGAGVVGAAGQIADLGEGNLYRKKEGQTEPEGKESAKKPRPKPTTRIRLEPNKTYNENGYKFETDELGRMKRASGDLKLDDTVPRDDYAQKVVGGSDRLGSDAGGHMIANRFGGPGGYENLHPIDSNLNVSAWKKMENGWATLLSKGKKVSVDIKIEFAEGSVRPSKFIVDYTVDGEPSQQTFFNASSK